MQSQAAITLKQSNDGYSFDGYSFDGSHAISATTYSVPIALRLENAVSIQFTCPSTGTPSGTFTVEGSNDKAFAELANGSDAGLVNWSTLSFWDEATATWLQSKTVSGASSFLLTLPIAGTRNVRVKYVNTSGSITATIKMQVKG